MVKAVVGEENQLKLAEERLSQSQVPAQVGLVIGKLSSTLDRGFVFDLIPTPLNDSGEPACSITEPVKDDKKRGSKPKFQSADSASLVIDKDWVAEHARQVSRMLLGGMKVVGIYVWASDSSFKNSTMMLCQTVKGVSEAAPEVDLDERLLLHICYSPSRWSCRNCSLASNITSSSLRPCDFKMGKVLSSLQTFRCMYNFSIRVPIFAEDASKDQTLSNFLHRVISVHAKQLRVSKALVDGNLSPTNRQLLGQVLKIVKDEPCMTDALHEIELLVPFLDDTHLEDCRQKDVLGILIFNGSVCSYAYVNSKEPISQAVSDIKGDIIRSLHSRLDIICDEADGDSGSRLDIGEAANEMSMGKPIAQLALDVMRKGCNFTLPRRAFLQWLSGIHVCDYLQSSETIEVLKDHYTELLSKEPPVDTATILEPEAEAPSLVTNSFWDVAIPIHKPASSSCEKRVIEAKGQCSGKSRKSLHVNVVAATIILFLSICVSFVLFRLKDHI